MIWLEVKNSVKNVYSGADGVGILTPQSTAWRKAGAPQTDSTLNSS